MKKLIAVIAFVTLLGLPGLAAAQPVASEIQSFPLAILYNVQAASPTYIYCRTEGAARVGNDTNRKGPSGARVTAAANSTTLAAVTTGTNPFANVAVGDIIYVQDPTPISSGGTIEKVVSARASADSITLSSVISVPYAFTGSFEFRKRQCGTGITAGWFPLEGYRPVKFSVAANTIGATSVDIRFECREQGEDAQPHPVCISNGVCSATGILTIPAASAGFLGRYSYVIGVNDNWKECRVGLGINGAGTQSVTMRATTAR